MRRKVRGGFDFHADAEQHPIRWGVVILLFAVLLFIFFGPVRVYGSDNKNNNTAAVGEHGKQATPATVPAATHPVGGLVRFIEGLTEAGKAVADVGTAVVKVTDCYVIAAAGGDCKEPPATVNKVPSP